MIARFRADLAKVLPEGLSESCILHVAVSGGPDSLALLLLAHAALPGRVRAATVDHGLRPESADEAELVAGLCREIGVVHQTISVRVPAGNVQSNARLARYAALEKWLAEVATSGDALATAHHADDQAETLLMRLNRASGLAGLAGIRRRRTLDLKNGTQIALVRPLLDWRRSELSDFLAHACVEAAQDPSNEDLHYDRVQMRKRLAEANWIDPLALSESAGHLAEALELIEELAEREWQLRVDRRGSQLSYSPGHHRLVSLEVIRRVLEQLDGSATRKEIAQMYERLLSGKNASLAGVLATPSASFDEAIGEKVLAWYFRKEPPRSN